MWISQVIIKLNAPLWDTLFTRLEKSVLTKKEGLNKNFQDFRPWSMFYVNYLKPYKGDKSTRLIYSTEGGPENGSQTEKMLAHCLRMVDIENISKILLTFVGHRDKVTSIALHPELPIFASAGKVVIKTIFKNQIQF